MKRLAAIVALFAILLTGGAACKPVCPYPNQHVVNGQCV